jgi:D-sedoheptulose 7-phosphate isomerase
MRTISPKGRAEAQRIIAEFFAERPDLTTCRDAFEQTFRVAIACFRANRTLFLCGNGGSYADCLHIGGELLKTFERRRPLPAAHHKALKRDPYGKDLANEIQAGFRALPLGLNASLVSAILNDSNRADLHFAQELYVMGQKGDLLLAISTSGSSRNVLNAMAVARVLGIRTIGLTGPKGGEVAERADIALRLPGPRTRQAQESHLACYHALCLAIEATFFPENR